MGPPLGVICGHKNLSGKNIQSANPEDLKGMDGTNMVRAIASQAKKGRDGSPDSPAMQQPIGSEYGTAWNAFSTPKYEGNQ